MEEKRKDTGSSPVSTADAPSPATEPPSSRRRGGGLKRKAALLSGGNSSTPPSTSSSKRQAREKSSSALFPPIHNGPCTRARQQPNYGFDSDSDSASFWDPVVKSEAAENGGGRAVKVEEELTARREKWEKLEAEIEADYETIRLCDTNAHVVPIPCGWFSWTKVHPLEELALPSFFNGKSKNRSPEICMEIRSSIMKRFHANPNKLIGVEDLSELSVGELDARQEVMEFLDYWGLINYRPFPDNDTTDLAVDADKATKLDSLVQTLYQFEMEHSCTPVAPRTNMTTPAVPSRMLPDSVIAEELVKPEGPAVEYHCNSCSADCSRKRYHCQKQADFDLCVECFNSRKFDSDMSPSDFILMEPAVAAGASGGKWTDQETLLLLEALELFSENWNEIAEHVATKTKAQCILHFVQMPIEDSFMECDDEIDASLKENAAGPTATNNDTPASNDAPETTESKDAASAGPTATNNDTSASDDAPEMSEVEDGVSDKQPLSTPMEILTPEEAGKPKCSPEIGENCAVKAIKEAFEAVGSLPSPEEKLSFANAGNPVMTLAAFLGRLVEPNVVTATARGSLKAISGHGSGVQLAARHCFILEDPGDENKKSSDSESDVTEMVEEEGQKDNKDNEKQKEVKSSLLIDSNESSNDQDNGKGKNLGTEEKELLVSTDKGKDLVTERKGQSDTPIKDEHFVTDEKDKGPDMEEKGLLAPSNIECTERSCGATEAEVIDTDEKVEASIMNKSNIPELQKEQAPSIPEGTDKATSKGELPSSPGAETVDSGDGAPVTGAFQSTEAQKDEEMVSDTRPSEKTERHTSITSTSLVENGAKSGEEQEEDCKEDEPPSETKNHLDIKNLKRAAVTAISAAAVKAKLLADEEEDQIRQLATSLIEKQLHKLETKMAFFTEMESVVARVRDQLERSKQRLYHERAQIIASRLGMSASSSRPVPQTLPNRVAMTFPNAMQRPPLSMTSQRPPTVPATVLASSVLPPNQDNLSSVVGMK